jgi:hypothetical protein
MTDPNKINPKTLNKRRGFRSYKPNAMTGAERLRKHRAKIGGRSLNFYVEPDAAASMLYIMKQWGMGTYKEAVQASLRYLAKETRLGLTKLELDIEPDLDDIDDFDSQ